MVVKQYYLFLLTALLSTQPAWSAVQLTPQDVVNRILHEGRQSKEIDLQTQQAKLPLAQAQSAYDWKASASTSYDYIKPKNITGVYNDKDETLATSLGLSRKFSLGTDMSINFSRSSVRSILGANSLTQKDKENVQDNLSLSVTQPLLNDFGGFIERNKIEIETITYNNQVSQRSDKLQDLVMENLRLFWQAYVAQENLKASINSRSQYEKLLEVVRRKNQLGYANPGELSRLQAEFESRVQQVKTNSSSYLDLVDNILTKLRMPKGNDIEFVVADPLPPVPKLSSIDPKTLRRIKIQENKVKTADMSIDVTKSQQLPNLNLKAKVATLGVDKTAEGSLGEVSSQSHPEYYVGIEFSKTFGSDFNAKELATKKVAKLYEETVLERVLDETIDQHTSQERKVQMLFATAQSALTQKKYREKTVDELSNGYRQGRSPLNELIDAMNAFFTSQANSIRSIGDYHIALNEWAALRDELITSTENSDNKEKTKVSTENTTASNPNEEMSNGK